MYNVHVHIHVHPHNFNDMHQWPQANRLQKNTHTQHYIVVVDLQLLLAEGHLERCRVHRESGTLCERVRWVEVNVSAQTHSH